MYDNWNYPAGADADPNAPWHDDGEDKIEKKAIELAQQDADDIDDYWYEWIEEKYDMSYNELSEEEIEAKCRECAKDKDVVFEFYKRYDDHYREKAIESLSNDEPDYEDD